MSKHKDKRHGRDKVYYATQFRQTEKNKSLKVGRHLRSNPFDKVAMKRYEALGKDPRGLGTNAKGRKLIAIMTS